jgi:hypothetical protein
VSFIIVVCNGYALHFLGENMVFVKKEFSINSKLWDFQSPYGLNCLGRKRFYWWKALPINANANASKVK